MSTLIARTPQPGTTMIRSTWTPSQYLPTTLPSTSLRHSRGITLSFPELPRHRAMTSQLLQQPKARHGQLRTHRRTNAPSGSSPPPTAKNKFLNTTLWRNTPASLLGPRYFPKQMFPGYNHSSAPVDKIRLGSKKGESSRSGAPQPESSVPTALPLPLPKRYLSRLPTSLSRLRTWRTHSKRRLPLSRRPCTAKLKHMELQMKAVEQAVKGLEPAEAFFGAFLKTQVGEDLMYTYDTWHSPVVVVPCKAKSGRHWRRSWMRMTYLNCFLLGIFPTEVPDPRPPNTRTASLVKPLSRLPSSSSNESIEARF
nr:hypothetical protein Iba_chr03bCG0650 [Ipomoea batatas]